MRGYEIKDGYLPDGVYASIVQRYGDKPYEELVETWFDWFENGLFEEQYAVLERGNVLTREES